MAWDLERMFAMKCTVWIKRMLPIVGALTVLIAMVAYISSKLISERAYRQKWEEYDECGLA